MIGISNVVTIEYAKLTVVNWERHRIFLIPLFLSF